MAEQVSNERARTQIDQTQQQATEFWRQQIVRGGEQQDAGEQTTAEETPAQKQKQRQQTP